MGGYQFGTDLPICAREIQTKLCFVLGLVQLARWVKTMTAPPTAGAEKTSGMLKALYSAGRVGSKFCGDHSVVSCHVLLVVGLSVALLISVMMFVLRRKQCFRELHDVAEQEAASSPGIVQGEETEEV